MRKRHERELLQKSTLESVGRLAVGIAHEVNTPLTNASINLQRLENAYKKQKTDEFADERIAAIGRNIDRASMIATELLKHVRQDIVDKFKMPLVDLVDGALKCIEAESGHVTIDRAVDPTLEVYCDPIKLEQAFVNILNNAMEAMPDGGQMNIQGAKENDKIILKFIDSGNGMSEACRIKAFDPFYTTKPVGEGTGLGLSITHEIIRSHQGDIFITNSTGKGTTVKVQLPA